MNSRLSFRYNIAQIIKDDAAFDDYEKRYYAEVKDLDVRALIEALDEARNKNNELPKRDREEFKLRILN